MDRPEERLALIEWLDRDGHVLRAVDVWRWPLSIGRALDNVVVLDDPHVAAYHVVIERVETELQAVSMSMSGPEAELASAPAHRTEPDSDREALRLRVMQTLNPVHFDGQLVASGQQRALRPAQPPAAPHAGLVMHIGQTRLRLRLRADVLAPEQALAPTSAPTRSRMAWCAVALAALLALSNWISLDPGADLTAWLPLLLGLPTLVAVWCGAWALVSKLFQGRFDFMGHAAIALPWFLVVEVVDLLLPQVAATLGWPLLWRLTGPITALIMAWLLREHFCLVLPRARRGISVALAALLLSWAAVTWTLNLRQHDRLDAAPYMGVLPMAGWRLGAPAKPDDVVQAMQPLRERLKARVDKATRDEPEGGDSGD